MQARNSESNTPTPTPTLTPTQKHTHTQIHTRVRTAIKLGPSSFPALSGTKEAAAKGEEPRGALKGGPVSGKFGHLRLKHEQLK